jgi:hypothetical protein
MTGKCLLLQRVISKTYLSRILHRDYLIEGREVMLTKFRDRVIGVELPKTDDYEVVKVDYDREHGGYHYVTLDSGTPLIIFRPKHTFYHFSVSNHLFYVSYPSQMYLFATRNFVSNHPSPRCRAPCAGLYWGGHKSESEYTRQNVH